MKTPTILLLTLLLASCDHLCVDRDDSSPTPPPLQAMDEHGNTITDFPDMGPKPPPDK